MQKRKYRLVRVLAVLKNLIKDSKELKRVRKSFQRFERVRRGSKNLAEGQLNFTLLRFNILFKFALYAHLEVLFQKVSVALDGKRVQVAMETPGCLKFHQPF